MVIELMPNTPELARTAFNAYKAVLNAGGANVRPTFDELPELMKEAWAAVVDALRERTDAQH